MLENDRIFYPNLACGSHGDVIRVLMPLTIADEQQDKGLGIMEEGLTLLRR